MDLRNEVMIAFSKVAYPGDDRLTACGCEECRWEVGRFRGKRWNRLTLDDFGALDGGANFALLTPAAFHYFLPGLLMLALDDLKTGRYLLDQVIGRITASDREGEQARREAEQVVKRLTLRQRQVLVALLRQAEGPIPDVPVIWLSAIVNLTDGIVAPYAHDSVERWLAEKYGGRSGYPQAAKVRSLNHSTERNLKE